MSEMISNKPSALRIAMNERLKNAGYGVAALFLAASSVMLEGEPELSHEEPEKSEYRYLERQGCDEAEYRDGGVPFCPDIQEDEQSITSHNDFQ